MFSMNFAMRGVWIIYLGSQEKTGSHRGNRTLTPLRETDFKSAASTVPPCGLMVIATGFEPVADCLEGSCSDPLSYATRVLFTL